ncbi:MAG TPA: hypothetical protein VED67_03495, partial [Thermodesulfovibrionales bacterium]|nr:hypothetical protein [Thermodesulfovibrionales bacterium]
GGDGFIKPLLIVAILVIAGYVGLEFGIPQYRYSAFKSEVKEIARLELGNVEKIRAQIYAAAQEYKIPIEEQDIVLTKKTNTVRVQTSWSATVDIFGIYQKTLNFTVDVEE